MNVLVALDGSKIGEQAAQAIADWGPEAGRVHLLTVIDTESIHGTRQESARRSGPPDGRGLASMPTISGDTGAVLISVDKGDAPPPPLETRGQALTRAREAGEAYLNQVAKTFFASREVEFQIEFAEHTAEAIVDAARAASASVIAMGTHGRSGLRHVLMGSVAERVVRISPIPVLVVGPANHSEGTSGTADQKSTKHRS